jgi:predicted ATPase with chaperone activity
MAARYQKRISGSLLNRIDVHVEAPRLNYEKLSSGRAYHRILRLARTIADLAGSADIQTAHLVEVFQHRPRRQI